IVQNSLIHVCFLEIHRLFFRLYNAIAGLDCIFGGRGTSSQCRDMPLNFSLLLFKPLSHDGQVNCHLFVSFRRTVHTREYYTSFSLSAVISSNRRAVTLPRDRLQSALSHSRPEPCP